MLRSLFVLVLGLISLYYSLQALFYTYCISSFDPGYIP
jgi:hypothetical protein